MTQPLREHFNARLGLIIALPADWQAQPVPDPATNGFYTGPSQANYRPNLVITIIRNSRDYNALAQEQIQEMRSLEPQIAPPAKTTLNGWPAISLAFAWKDKATGQDAVAKQLFVEHKESVYFFGFTLNRILLEQYQATLNEIVQKVSFVPARLSEDALWVNKVGYTSNDMAVLID